ncbi:MAG: type II toxin-antitoxin system RelE/ParE family toxin [Thauera sp.]|jgi:addiction module RelE/StbE family toxin|nr:type II toxin-antitoxin system RelE/ParE family toxin [Thauera sp.]
MTKLPYLLEWRPAALEDLRAIVRHIAKDNPTRAQSFAQELRSKAELLQQHPLLGRTGRPGLPAWLRELIAHHNYLILYRVHDKTRTIEVLRVKHAAQQLP